MSDVNSGTGSGSLGSYQITAWGDSLTVGGQDLTKVGWPDRLVTLTGQKVINLGMSAETSSQIAVRMNAYAGQPEQTFAAAFTFPTSGTVNLRFQTGFEATNDGYRAKYPKGVPISFTVGGETYTGNVIETVVNGPYIFTPSTYPAAPFNVPSGTPWITVTPSGINSGCVVIWAGRNNYVDSTQVQADIVAMVATVQQSTSCWLVLSVPNLDAPTEWKGSNGYNDIISLDNALSAAYSPGNHYLDIRSALVQLYDPANPADVLDHANDVWPYSLRAQDVSGSLKEAVDSLSTCAISTTGLLKPGQIISFDAELIFVSGGSSGDYTCMRGYAGTTPETYSSGTAYTGVDSLHLGQNLESGQNPYFTNGYYAVASEVYAWLKANGPK